MDAPHHDPRLNWPHSYVPPSPFVTHEHLAPLHTKIGALEKGHEAVLSTYSHLRGEMLGQFDRLERLMRETREQATATPPPAPQGVTMSMHSVIVAAVALVLTGIILSRIPGIENMIGGG